MSMHRMTNEVNQQDVLLRYLKAKMELTDLGEISRKMALISRLGFFFSSFVCLSFDLRAIKQKYETPTVYVTKAKSNLRKQSRSFV